MDQHPIPQDVTGFQFKLIGSMTVKQFGYVATGVIAAVILYYLPLKIALAFLIKMILIPLFGASGFIIAFLPIEGRPIDVMVRNFITALFSPNQYVYHKVGRRFSFSTVSLSRIQPAAQPTSKASQKKIDALEQQSIASKKQQLRVLLINSHGKHTALDDREEAFLNSLDSLSSANISSLPPFPTEQPTLQPIMPTTPVQSPIIIQQVPQQQVEEEPVSPLKEAQPEPEIIQPEPEKLEKPEPAPTIQEPSSVSKQQLGEDIDLLKKELILKNNPLKEPSKPPPPVDSRPLQISKNAGQAYIPDTPNVVVGIVKDPRGNVLPSMLVEIKDKDGIPVRAFKTNALGQFASATPLSPGAYTVEIEDPKKQNIFDIFQINVNNEIMAPIETISHDAREELRKSLFN